MIVLPFAPINGLGLILHIILLFGLEQRPTIHTAKGYLGLCWAGTKYASYCLFNWSNKTKKPLILEIKKELSTKYFYPLNKDPVLVMIYGIKDGNVILGKILNISVSRNNCTGSTNALEISKNSIKVVKTPNCSNHIPVWSKSPVWLNETLDETCVFEYAYMTKKSLYVLVFNCTTNRTKQPIKILEVTPRTGIWSWKDLGRGSTLKMYSVNMHMLFIGNDTYVYLPYLGNTGGFLIGWIKQALIVIINKSNTMAIEIFNETFNNISIHIVPKSIRSIKARTIKHYNIVLRNISIKNVVMIISKNNINKPFYVLANNSVYKLFIFNGKNNNLYIEGLPIYYKNNTLFLPNEIDEKDFILYLNNNSTIIATGY